MPLALVMLRIAVLSASLMLVSSASLNGATGTLFHAVSLSAAGQTTTPQNETVYVTKTGKKYHRAGCRSLSKSAIPMKLKDAASTYAPCGVCKPPVMH